MDKKALGKENREITLKLISILGYATTRQIAKTLRENELSHSSLNSATRMLRIMRDEKLILTERLGDLINNEQIAGLADKGARYLNEEFGDNRTNTRDYMRHQHAHRTACNSVFCAYPNTRLEVIAALNGRDRTVWSELEIRQGTAPICKFDFTYDGEKMQKIPDLLWLGEKDTAEGVQETLVWVEVENNWRSEKDLNKLVWAMQVMSTKPVYFEFVITKSVAHSIKERLRVKLLHTKETGVPRQQMMRDDEIWKKLTFKELNHETLALTDM